MLGPSPCSERPKTNSTETTTAIAKEHETILIIFADTVFALASWWRLTGCISILVPNPENYWLT